MRIDDKEFNISKSDVILEATLELVSELGLKGTTISQISKRAKLSPGIIYYYFNSKDEILHTLYRDLELAFIEAVNKKNPLSKPILECYKTLWLRTYNFGIENPNALIFVESYQNSIYYKDRISNGREQFLSRLQEKTSESIKSGELKPLPIEAIYAIVIRPAFELSKLKLAGIDFLYGTTIEEIASSICKSLLKTQ